ncbi:sperm acrosome membrane-associated protein 4-like [Dromiciops gliroides]|uniref:sperm acrosome membrane-associated protein 4-like n=1 Tax=Dromiciops gliroides TaxID=33562 RepID=UPI001CC3518C|nr:sperm acrosome membrane-associated protein 4-like [Dromiciops gliroides]
MHHCLIMTIALSLLTPLIESRHCYYCNITNSGNCLGVQITCAEEYDCYIGRGAVLGLPTVIKKGCVEPSHCGQEQQIPYMGTTYSLITYCCHSELCNMNVQARNRTFINVAVSAATANLSAKDVLIALLLFLL